MCDSRGVGEGVCVCGRVCGGVCGGVGVFVGVCGCGCECVCVCVYVEGCLCKVCQFCGFP